MIAIRQVTQPPYEPVSLADAKGWLLIDDDITEHDAVVSGLIKSAREFAENLTLRAFIPRQFRLTTDGWPYDCDYGSKITLPNPPLISVDSIFYVDTSGNSVELTSDKYDLHAQYEPAIAVPPWATVWPVMRRVPNALTVLFTAGYIGSPFPSSEAEYQAVMPGSLRTWMQTKLATLFENRDRLIIGSNMFEVPRDMTDALLDGLVVGTRLF